MLTVSPSLAAILTGSPTKVDWAAKVRTALGTARRVRCFRDSNAAATSPATTGTEFLNLANTGTLTLYSGDITDFGIIGAASVNLAADLGTGACVLRIEGGGHWVQGTLGLPGSGKDFILGANPTGAASVGFSFSAGTGVKSPPLLATGVGPIPPLLDANAPAKFRIINYTNPAAPVTVGTIPFDTRDVNLVMTDPEVAESMGDVRVTKSSQTIIFDAFEFGILLLSMNADCNAEAAVPLHQVLVNCRPYGTAWAAKYPSVTGYDATSDVTIPPPFKGQILDASDRVLYTFELHDGLPINDPSTGVPRSTTVALRPSFTCANMLFWQSHEPKMNAKARKFFNGFKTDILRPSTCKISWGSGAWVPMSDDDKQIDGTLHMNALPQWPMANAPYNSIDYPNAVDPYLFDSDAQIGSSIHRAWRVSGWDYEVGSISGQDRYTGPGGPRPNRCYYPAWLSLYMTQPNGVRLKGNVPYKSGMWAYTKAYFNQSRHFFRDVKSFASIPVAEANRNEWMHTGSYYGDGTVANPDNRIPLFTTRLTGGGARDKFGRRPWNGDAVDYMHAHEQAGHGALFLNSPAHLVSHKHYYISNCLAWFGGGRVANPDYTSRFMARQDAWHWGTMTMAWKLASEHPTLGISRALVEDRMQYNLDSMRKTVMAPAQNGTPGIYFDGIRNLGTPLIDTTEDQPGGYHAARSQSGCSSMSFYMAAVFLTMKTTGVWDMLWNKSQANRDAMTFWIQCYDRYSLDWAIDTDGRYEYYMNGTVAVPVGAPLPPVAASWADWAANVQPKTGVEDWVRRPNGNPYGGVYNDQIERDSPQHFRAQYAFMRRDFDFYVPNATKIAAACAKYQGWYDAIEQRVASMPTPLEKSAADWRFRWPGAGIFTPTVSA
jgi:hypothetical protein